MFGEASRERTADASEPVRRKRPYNAKRTPLDRFWASVTKTDGCWLWTGIKHRDGYGKISINGRYIYAHQASYRFFVGELTPGLVIDHKCHSEDPACEGGRSCPHRACVNPAHLEQVTDRENLMRGRNPLLAKAAKTECVRGHAFDAANTGRTSRGTRYCRACHRIANAAYALGRTAK